MKHVLHLNNGIVNDWIVYVAVGCALSSYVGFITGHPINEVFFWGAFSVLSYLAFLFQSLYIAVGVVMLFVANVAFNPTQRTLRIFGPFKYVDLFHIVVGVALISLTRGLIEL